MKESHIESHCVGKLVLIMTFIADFATVSLSARTSILAAKRVVTSGATRIAHCQKGLSSSLRGVAYSYYTFPPEPN